jgi:FKBP-type peptidyl-prolyl cis-trans isomerase (trigger factor)
MRVLDEMVEGATLSFPEVMVDERIHQMIDEFAQNLQQQGIDLETYQKITGTTHEQFHEQYHDSAVQSVKRSIVLGEIMIAEKVRVADEQIDEEIDGILAQFGESAESLRDFINQPSQRADIANRLLYSNVIERIAEIGRGEAPSLEELEAAEAEAEETDESADEESETENSEPADDVDEEPESAEETDETK